MFVDRNPGKELNRVLKKGGIIISVSTSTAAYEFKKYQFSAAHTDFPENDNLVSGAKVKLQLYSLDFAFEDYYWSKQDYFEFLGNSNFNDLDVYYPLGTKEDGLKWRDELTVSPVMLIKGTKY